jgi:SPP1 gp7 family putative phage head morphogenesis protein
VNPRALARRVAAVDAVIPAPEDAPIRRRLPRPPDGRRDDRYIFGSGLNLEKIALAYYAADMGAPRMLTDLSRETLQVDPHLVATLQKRFTAVSSLPVKVTPATGPGIDPGRAKFYADVVRANTLRIANLRRAIKQIAWGIFDGRAALEKFWAYAPGATTEWGQVRYTVAGLGWIHPRRIFFGPERELRVIDRPLSIGFSLDGLALRDYPHKFIEFTPQIFGEYPEREGLVRGALYWSFFKRIGARERMILQELYAKPWRWAEVEPDTDLGPDEVDDLDRFVEMIAAAGYGRLPRGAKFKTESPGGTDSKGGTIMKEVIDDSDRQISKLVLGQTGTTDGTPSGLNSNQTAIMKDEQLQILQDDAAQISEVMDDFLSDDIIEVNFGREALSHAPTLSLDFDITDRKTETERVDKVLRMGVPLALRDVYEITGYRQPDANEAMLRLEPGTPGAADPLTGAPGAPGADRIVITYPPGESPSARELSPPPVPAVPAPDATPGVSGGTEDSTADDAEEPIVPAAEETDPEHTGSASGDLEPSDAETSARGENADSSELQSGITASLRRSNSSGGRPAVFEASGGRITESGAARLVTAAGSILAEELITALGDLDRISTSSITLASLNKQPASVFGSPESIIDRAIKKFALETRGWADKLIKSAAGKTRAGDIMRATRDVASSLDTGEFQREYWRSTLHAEMLGALDSQYSRETDIEVEPAKFALPAAAAKPGFANMSYKNALEYFTKKSTMTRADFDKLNAGAKARAFTFARTTSSDLLKLVHSELGRMIADGHDLKQFQKFMKERVESAGWTPANASHVQTIARTNTMGAYNAGRLKDMTTTAALIDRPYWQIRGVDDSRQRDTHGAVNGKVFAASDPMWDSIHPPFGYNCRCRSVSLSAKQVKNRGLEVSQGSSVSGLPDKGFDAPGVRGLLGAFGL